jgi:hypothetical protein
MRRLPGRYWWKEKSVHNPGVASGALRNPTCWPNVDNVKYIRKQIIISFQRVGACERAQVRAWPVTSVLEA